MRKIMLLAVAVGAALSLGAYTFHRSFRNGYPAEISEARSRAVSAGGPTATVGVKGASAATRSTPRTVTRTKGAKAPNKLVGTVTRTAGGEVVWVQEAGGERPVRLEKILVPQGDQPFAPQAAKFLDDLVKGKSVEVLWTKRQDGGGIVGVVYYRHPMGMVEVNLTMVKNGCAWHDAPGDRTPAYGDAEKEARTAKRGLWGGDKPVNPRRWKAAKKAKPKAAAETKDAARTETNAAKQEP